MENISKNKVVVILTCFNRKEKTVKCVKSLSEGNENVDFTFLVVDDKSTDGTKEALSSLKNVYIEEGTGSLFWNGGMHRGIAVAKEKFREADYYLLVNDDVEFYESVIEEMIIEEMIQDCAGKVLVGATCDDKGELSYGGILYHSKRSLKYRMIGPDEPDISCSTFNANCVLIPREIFMKADNIDSYYQHSMGDFDYGFGISRMGVTINVFKRFIGVCNDNPKEGTWQDTSLGIRERIRLKESRKGLPRKDWFHYINKNFNLFLALTRSVTPYIKILLRK